MSVYTKFDEQIYVVKLSTEKGYYAKKLDLITINTSGKAIFMDIAGDSTLLAVGCDDGRSP